MKTKLFVLVGLSVVVLAGVFFVNNVFAQQAIFTSNISSVMPVGYNWNITVTGLSSGEKVYSYGGKAGETVVVTDGKVTQGVRVEMGTATNGTLVLSGTHKTEDIGDWQTTWTRGDGTVIGNLAFSIIPSEAAKGIPSYASFIELTGGETRASAAGVCVSTNIASFMEVGDSWNVTITGLNTGDRIYANGGKANDEQAMGIVPMPSSANVLMGTADAEGKVVSSGTFITSEIGDWRETWYRKGGDTSQAQIGKLSFRVANGQMSSIWNYNADNSAAAKIAQADYDANKVTMAQNIVTAAKALGYTASYIIEAGNIPNIKINNKTILLGAMAYGSIKELGIDLTDWVNNQMTGNLLHLSLKAMDLSISGQLAALNSAFNGNFPQSQYELMRPTINGVKQPLTLGVGMFSYPVSIQNGRLVVSGGISLIGVAVPASALSGVTGGPNCPSPQIPAGSQNSGGVAATPPPTTVLTTPPAGATGTQTQDLNNMISTLNALVQKYKAMVANIPTSGGTGTVSTPPVVSTGSGVNTGTIITGFPSIITVTAGNLNVRSAPSTSASPAGSNTLHAGDQFVAVESVTGDNVEGESMWWKSSKGNYVWSGGTIQKSPAN